MNEYQMLINGSSAGSLAGKIVVSWNPANGEPAGRYHYGGTGEAEMAVQAARTAFDSGPWPRLTPAERAVYLSRLADLLQSHITLLSAIETADSGGLRNRTAFDVMQGARFIRRMAGYSAHRFEWKKELPKGSAMNPSINYQVREPIGVCVGIIPWNFPLLMALWKIAMAIVTGNTIVLKPSPETPLSALLLGQIIIKSGLPPGVVNIVTGEGKEVGEYLVQHPLVDRIAFTGSFAVGKRILEMSSVTMKRVSLELGGKSANIILGDADMDMAIDGAMFAAFLHSGQVCESGSRLLIPAEKADAILGELNARIRKIRIGNPADPLTQMGPLISKQHLARVNGYVEQAVENGAVVLTGGKRRKPAGFESGFYYEPTVLDGVHTGMRVFHEEIFGPVLTITTFENEQEAVILANNSSYGLAAGIWSRNIGRAKELAAQLKAGTVWINDWHMFHDFGPFGGYRRSGLGRELGQEGLESYTEVKHLHIGIEWDANARPGHRVFHDRDPAAGYEQILPTRVISGPGSVSRLAGEMKFSTRIFLITDQGVSATKIIGRIRDIIGEYVVAVFDEIPQDSGIEIVNKAVDMGRRIGINTILSVGGGSVIDTGKAIAAALGMGSSAEELIGVNNMEGKSVRHIAVPTTAGSGSEVTNVAVLKNEFLGIKSYILDDAVFPELAILDPELCFSLPPLLTAATGFDALCHAIEAVMSRRSNPHSDALALQAITLICRNLEHAVNNGNDPASRAALLNAANLAGMAIVNARVGLVHAMSHALSALHGIAHGVANGILLPYVIRWNASPEVSLRFVRIAVAMDLPDRTDTTIRQAEKVALAVTSLLQRCSHPVSLGKVGLSAGDLDACARTAITDLAILSNIRQVNSANEILAIYQAAL